MSSIFKDSDMDSSGTHGAEGPERFSTDDDKPPTTQTRRTSIADTLIDGFRGVRRKVSQKKSSVPAELQTPRKRSADTIPLPSSPIPIRNAPPALSLNLGPMGFMPQAFGNSLEREDTRLTDPDNITRGVPDRHGLHVPAELEAKASSNTSSLRLKPIPSGILHIPLDDFTFDATKSPAHRDGLATPMPGTNLTLEMDGTNEKSRVFERSVEITEPSPTHSTKGLRPMRSLDALTQFSRTAELINEANALARVRTAGDAVSSQSFFDHVQAAPGTDTSGPETQATAVVIDDIDIQKELVESPTSAYEDIFAPHLKPAPLVIPSRDRPSNHRDLLSASTIDGCPADMPALCPQANPSDRDVVDHGDIERWQQGGIASTANEKYARDKDERRDSVMQPMLSAGFSPPSPKRSLDLPYRPKLAIDIHATANAPPAPATPLFPNTCRRVEPSPSVHVNDSAATSGRKAPLEHVCDDADSVITDCDEFKTQHFFGTHGEDMPEESTFEDADARSLDGSPNVAPLMAGLYQAAASSQNSSPTRSRGNTLRSTDVGAVFWRFSANNWMGEDNTDITQVSIDDDSDPTEGTMSPIRSSSTEFQHTPSMGNRIDFELQRSDRNARYNALQTGFPGHIAQSSDRPASAEWTFGGQELALQVELPPLVKPMEQYEAEAKARAEERARGKRASTLSEESAVNFLELAVRDTNHAQAMLFADEPEMETKYDDAHDAVQTSSPKRLTKWERENLDMPSQALGSGYSAKRERSPKKVTHAELVTPAALSSSPTGGIETGGFSPTASMIDVACNRFAMLDELSSSPPDTSALRDGSKFGGIKNVAACGQDGLATGVKSDDGLMLVNSQNSGYDADSSGEDSPEEQVMVRSRAARELLLATGIAQRGD